MMFNQSKIKDPQFEIRNPHAADCKLKNQAMMFNQSKIKNPQFEIRNPKSTCCGLQIEESGHDV